MVIPCFQGENMRNISSKSVGLKCVSCWLGKHAEAADFQHLSAPRMFESQEDAEEDDDSEEAAFQDIPRQCFVTFCHYENFVFGAFLRPFNRGLNAGRCSNL